MEKLTQEQIKFLANHFDLTDEEVIDNQKELINTLAFVIEELKKVWLNLAQEFLGYWEKIKPCIYKMYSAYQEHAKEHHIKFFKKKKTQRKNWNKWKKRK